MKYTQMLIDLCKELAYDDKVDLSPIVRRQLLILVENSTVEVKKIIEKLKK
jgi:hypothetical protein